MMRKIKNFDEYALLLAQADPRLRRPPEVEKAAQRVLDQALKIGLFMPLQGLEHFRDRLQANLEGSHWRNVSEWESNMQDYAYTILSAAHRSTDAELQQDLDELVRVLEAWKDEIGPLQS